MKTRQERRLTSRDITLMMQRLGDPAGLFCILEG